MDKKHLLISWLMDASISFPLHLVLLLFLCLVCQAGGSRRLLSLTLRLSPLARQKAERQK
ncbi:hypothetical protein Mapa_009392 [Marchantia paleacea]|nr:hypothetical protein Mapa_009392 [Marchantia paleacea]